MLLSDDVKRIVVGWKSEEIDRNDTYRHKPCPSGHSDRCIGALRIKTKGIRINVGKNGRRSKQSDHFSGGAECQ
jgi:hypothetical protein